MVLKVAVTGATGFIGTHLCHALESDPRVGSLHRLNSRTITYGHLERALKDVSVVYHLGGIVRPDVRYGYAFNFEYTRMLCEHLIGWVDKGRPPLVVFASSRQAYLDNNDYGASKRAVEQLLGQYSAEGWMTSICVRLPNVFGPGARVYYQSVVATFCYQAAHGLQLTINDPSAPLWLVYIDDVVWELLHLLDTYHPEHSIRAFPSSYGHYTTVGKLAEDIQAIAELHKGGYGNDVLGLQYMISLYDTYVSYLPEKETTNEIQ